MANDKLVKLTGADIKTFSVPYKWRRKERTSINSCRRTIAVRDKDFAGSLFVYIIERKLQFRGEKQYLTSSLHSFVKYCFNHSKLIKFLSSRRRVVSFIYASKEWRFIVYFILLLFFNKCGYACSLLFQKAWRVKSNLAQLSLVQVIRKLDIVTIDQTKKYPR